MQRPDAALAARFAEDCAAASDGLIGAGDRFGVAVSGGPDSLALLLLATTAFPGRVHAISVDHRLRAEAAAECRMVAALCADLGVPHEIVAVEVVPAGRGLQAAAREARLAAFWAWCQDRDLSWVATAHHADDQAETVLMRLARGAGVAGLSGIDPMAMLPIAPRRTSIEAPPVWCAMLRPLLGWTRAELAAIVSAAGLQPTDDPSNADPRHDRTRFRALLRDAAPLLHPRRLAAVASHCRDADRALDWAMRTLADTILVESPCRVDLAIDALETDEREVVRRLVVEALRRLDAEPRGPAVERLIAALRAGRRMTLAGVRATPGAVWRFEHWPPCPPDIHPAARSG